MLSSTATACSARLPCRLKRIGQSATQYGAPSPPTPLTNSGGSWVSTSQRSAASRSNSGGTPRSRASHSSAAPAPLTVPSSTPMLRAASCHATLCSSPGASGGASAKSCCTNAPVPMLMNTVPGSGSPQANNAAGWSPVATSSGTSRPAMRSVPNGCLLGTDSGRQSRGIPQAASMSADQSRACTSHSNVREALAGSARQGRSSSSRYRTKLASGPQHSRPRASARCTSGR